MTDKHTKKPRETCASRLRNTLDADLTDAIESVEETTGEFPLIAIIDTQEKPDKEIKDNVKDHVPSDKKDETKFVPKTEPASTQARQDNADTATKPGTQSQPPQRSSSTNTPTRYLILPAQELGPIHYYLQPDALSVSLNNETRTAAQVFYETAARIQANNPNNWGAGWTQGIHTGAQSNAMYQHPRNYLGLPTHDYMPGQGQVYPFQSGAYQQYAYSMNNQPFFQDYGFQPRYGTHLNQSRLLTYQAQSLRSNLYGSVSSRMPQQPQSVKSPQVPPNNSRSGEVGVATGRNSQTESLLGRGEATSSVQTGNLQQPDQKSQPMPFVSSQISQAARTALNGSAENIARTGAVRKRQERIKDLMENGNSKSGQSTSKQTSDYDVALLHSISRNQASLELQNWSQEMIAEFAACITKVANNSDSLATEEQQLLANGGAAEALKNDHDYCLIETKNGIHDDYKAAILGRTSKKNTEIPPIPASSEDRESLTPKNKIENETEESDGPCNTANGSLPLNNHGRKVYDRDFLIKLRSNPNSNIKPLNLPKFDFVLEESSEVSCNKDHLGASKEDKVSEVLSTIVQAVWKTSKPQKFDSFADQIKLLNIDTQEKLQSLVELVFEKAIADPKSAEKYALMCRTLAKMRASGVGSKSGKRHGNNKFGQLIADRCRIEFDKWVDKDTRAKVKEEVSAHPERQNPQEALSLTKEEKKIRAKCYNNIRFMGELFKQNMLDTDSVHKCIDHLLKNIDDQSMGCLYKLLRRVGHELEIQNQNLEPYFKRIEEIVGHDLPVSVCRRVHYMLLKLIESRSNKWKPKMVRHTNEVHQEDTSAESESLARSCCTTEVDDSSQLISNLPQSNKAELKHESINSELLIETSGDSGGELSMVQIYHHLHLMLTNAKKNSFGNICSWISLNVGDRTSKPEFGKVLMIAILTATIELNNHTWQFSVDKFRSLQKLIPPYIDADINLLELQCLITIQEYIHRLEAPQRTLFEIIEKQIFESILSFDVFLACEGNNNVTPLNKKSAALVALKTFFNSLKKRNCSREETVHIEP